MARGCANILVSRESEQLFHIPNLQLNEGTISTFKRVHTVLKIVDGNVADKAGHILLSLFLNLPGIDLEFTQATHSIIKAILSRFLVRDCRTVLMYSLTGKRIHQNCQVLPKLSQVILKLSQVKAPGSFNLGLLSAKFSNLSKYSQARPVLMGYVRNQGPISILNFERSFNQFFIQEFISNDKTVYNLPHFTQYSADQFAFYGQMDTIYTGISTTFDRSEFNLLLQKLKILDFTDSLVTFLPIQQKTICNLQQIQISAVSIFQRFHKVPIQDHSYSFYLLGN